MPDSTFSNTTSGTGSSLTRSITVSGITGTITNVRYEVDFSSSNHQYIGAYVQDPSSTNVDIITLGSLSGSGSTTQGVNASEPLYGVNGTYSFTIGDYNNGTLTLSAFRVIVSYTSSGTNYSVPTDSGSSSTEVDDVDVTVNAVSMPLGSLEAEGYCELLDLYLSRRSIRSASFW